MTRLEFLTYVTNVFKRTDKNTEIYEALNETIKDIATREKFHEYSFQSYTACVAAQEDYPLPTTLLQIKHPIRLVEGTATGDSGWNLTKLSKEEYDFREPNPNRTGPSTGRPTAYCVYSNSILVTPIPDQAYLLEINWGNVPSSLASNDDSPAYLNIWDEVIKHGALFRMFSLVGAFTEANYWRALYETGILRMIDYNRDKSGGHVIIGAVNDL